ncbi:hypothetical protein HA466_0174390 [Hirschfeldia incana]|nr:hypothetical protein HA466_0174390 [Hirschfeldia incana]
MAEQSGCLLLDFFFLLSSSHLNLFSFFFSSQSLLKPSGPVALTEEEEAVLREGILLELSQWSAMKTAVDNGWDDREFILKIQRWGLMLSDCIFFTIWFRVLMSV